MPNYQPFWIKGKETGEYQRECAPRYDAIKKFIEKKYERRISCFDLGCNYGYFGIRLACELDCVSILVDTKPLSGVLQGNEPVRCVWLNKRLGADELRLLGESESFDVVLALNVVHHIPDWKGAVDALLNLGERVIFELPGKGDIGTVNYDICDDLREYVLSKPHDRIFEMESHVSGVMRPMVVVRGKNTITKQAIDAETRQCHPVEITITSNRKRKGIAVKHKRTTEMRSFHHGINLWNFKLLNGAWPVNIDEMVEKSLGTLNRFHDDLRPWNFILDGIECYPIDFMDKTHREEPEKDGLKKCLKLMQMEPDYNNSKFTDLLTTT